MELYLKILITHLVFFILSSIIVVCIDNDDNTWFEKYGKPIILVNFGLFIINGITFMLISVWS